MPNPSVAPSPGGGRGCARPCHKATPALGTLCTEPSPGLTLFFEVFSPNIPLEEEPPTSHPVPSLPFGQIFGTS